MRKTKTVMIAAILSMCGTAVFAADEAKAPSIQKLADRPEMNRAAAAPKPAALIGPSTMAGRVVRVVHKPVTIPAARDASLNTQKSFIYTSPKNTNTKIYYPTVQKDGPMPNLFKK